MRKRTYIIGIAGGTGSGKTTAAAGLAAALGTERTTVIDADSYYRDLSHLPLSERHHRNFDDPDALDFGLLSEHLRMLASGRAAAAHAYDFKSHCRSDDTFLLQPAPFIIVEGMLIFVPEELRRFFDLKVFLDEDADVRLLRRIRRDMAERGRTFDSVQRQYLEQVRPMHDTFVEPTKKHADLVIGTGASCSSIIARILSNMQAR